MGNWDMEHRRKDSSIVDIFVVEVRPVMACNENQGGAVNINTLGTSVIKVDNMRVISAITGLIVTTMGYVVCRLDMTCHPS